MGLALMPDPTALTQVQFRPGPLAGPLAERGEPSAAGSTARRDLGRYYALLARALGAVQLTEAEASLLCDASNGTLWEPASIPLLWAGVDDAIRLHGVDRQWGVDGPALVARLRALDAGASWALVDAVERFWRNPNPRAEALRRVGLVRP